MCAQVLTVLFAVWSTPTIASERCTAFLASGVDYWYPYVYRNEEGALTGVLVEAVQQSLSSTGVAVELMPSTPWKRILLQLERGEIDIVLGAYWNAERAKRFLYSVPVVSEELRVFVKAGTEFPLSSFDDLKGRQGLLLRGGSMGEKFDRYAEKNLTIARVTSSDQMLRMISLGRVDFGILGYQEGLHLLEQLGKSKEVVPLDWPLLVNDLHIMMNKNCAPHIKTLNDGIEGLRRQGDIIRLEQKHRQLEWGGN